MQTSKTGNDFFQESYPSLPFEPSKSGSKIKADAPQGVNRNRCILQSEPPM